MLALVNRMNSLQGLLLDMPYQFSDLLRGISGLLRQLLHLISYYGKPAAFFPGTGRLNAGIKG
ncbi:hypothetical protein D3C77_368540 [compost metagenome]